MKKITIHNHKPTSRTTDVERTINKSFVTSTEFHTDKYDAEVEFRVRVTARFSFDLVGITSIDNLSDPPDPQVDRAIAVQLVQKYLDVTP
jgi:hypothetical protein